MVFRFTYILTLIMLTAVQVEPVLFIYLCQEVYVISSVCLFVKGEVMVFGDSFCRTV